MQVLDYKGDKYPYFQSIGNASQFAIPYAKHFCEGFGYDIGCMKKEWSYPGSIAIDLDFDDPWDANHLPDDKMDYIFSSHCLEHVDDWVGTLNYWTDNLRQGGILFLYLRIQLKLPNLHHLGYLYKRHQYILLIHYKTIVSSSREDKRKQ